MPTKKPPVKKRAPKTLKEKRFVKELLRNGGNKVQAALVAYDTTNYKSATRIAHENAEKLRIPDLLDKFGLTDEHLVEDLKEGLQATKVLSATIYADGESGKPVNDFIETPDFAVRHKWWTSAATIRGWLKDQGDTNIQVNVLPILAAASVSSDDSHQQTPETAQEN